MILRLTVGRLGAGLKAQYGLAFRLHSTTQVKGPVGIFWDIENCSPYNYTSPAKLMRSLRTVFQQFGPIASVRSYQDVSKYTLNEIDRAGYSACGLQMVDTPHLGRKNVADWHMMTDIVGFAFNNPLPSTIVVITTDRDYCSLLNMLSNRMYNIVLVTNIDHVIEELASSASVMYNWKEFLDYASNGQKLNLSIEPPIEPHHTGLDPHWPSTVAHVPKQQRSSRTRSEVTSSSVSAPFKASPTSSSTLTTLPSMITSPATTTVRSEMVPDPATISTVIMKPSEPSSSHVASAGLTMEDSQGWSSTAFRVSTQSDAIYPLISPKIREKYNAVIRSVPRSHHNIISFGELTKHIERLQPDILQSIGVSSMSEVIEEAIRDGVLVMTNKGPKTHQLKLSRRVYQKSGLGAWLIRSGWGNKFDEIKALERSKGKGYPFIPVDSTKSRTAEADMERVEEELPEVVVGTTSTEFAQTVSSTTPANSDLVTDSDTPSTIDVSSEPASESAPIRNSENSSDSRTPKPANSQVDLQQTPISTSRPWIDVPHSLDKLVDSLSTESIDSSLSFSAPNLSATPDDALTTAPPLESERTPSSTSKSALKTRTTARITLNIPTLPTFHAPDDGPAPNPYSYSNSESESESVAASVAQPKKLGSKSKRRRRQSQRPMHDEAISNSVASTNTNKNGDVGAVVCDEGVENGVSNVINPISNIGLELYKQGIDLAKEGNDRKVKEVKVRKKTKKVDETGHLKKKTIEPLGIVKRPKGRPAKAALSTSKKNPIPGVLPKKIPPKPIDMPKKKKEKPSSEALAIKASVPSDRPWRILSSVLTNLPGTTPSSESSSSIPLTPSPPSSPPNSTSSTPGLQYQMLTPPDPTRVKLFSSFGVNKRLSPTLPSQTRSSPRARASEDQETMLSVLDSSLV